jgi:hypothetical protein
VEMVLRLTCSRFSTGRRGREIALVVDADMISGRVVVVIDRRRIVEGGR